MRGNDANYPPCGGGANPGDDNDVAVTPPNGVDLMVPRLPPGEGFALAGGRGIVNSAGGVDPGRTSSGAGTTGAENKMHSNGNIDGNDDDAALWWSNRHSNNFLGALAGSVVGGQSSRDSTGSHRGGLSATSSRRGSYSRLSTEGPDGGRNDREDFLLQDHKNVHGRANPSESRGGGGGGGGTPSRAPSERSSFEGVFDTASAVAVSKALAGGSINDSNRNSYNNDNTNSPVSSPRISSRNSTPIRASSASSVSSARVRSATMSSKSSPPRAGGSPRSSSPICRGGGGLGEQLSLTGGGGSVGGGGSGGGGSTGGGGSVGGGSSPKKQVRRSSDSRKSMDIPGGVSHNFKARASRRRCAYSSVCLG